MLATQAQVEVAKGERIAINLSAIPDSAFYEGVVAIKFKPQFTGLEKSFGVVNGVVQVQNPVIDNLLKTFGINGFKWLFKTVFANAADIENFEAVKHMEQWGFQQWFHFNFSKNTDVRLVVQAFLNSGVAEVAEPVFKIKQTWIPNDPRFKDQWHYNNAGQANGVPGADIKLPEAWDIEKGQPNVLVAVHDGGINYLHPDLAQNMWSGIGYNFITDNAQIIPDKHATHVSGAIAAVNNNNLGVSGIAGGNGSPGSGVRVMSMQIIGSGNGSAGYEALSFLYAANNGACISQNSWSYSTQNVFPQVTADAIDYFIQNGGGNVTKGGLVIFSAGNDNSERQFFPAPYSKVLSVAATNNKDIRSPYSSYGSFVDIAAPGGDQTSNGGGTTGGILSTVLGTGYDYMQGTSMACPQVSGVAALIASHLPGRLLGSDIRAILLSSTDDISGLNPSFTGKLGSGRLNAFKALQLANSIAVQPVIQPPVNVVITPLCDKVSMSWVNPTPNTESMIVYSDNGDIGLPFGKNYQVGETLPGGGQVLYKGIGNTATFPVAIDGNTMNFRVYVLNAAINNYSQGVNASYLVPFTISNPVPTAQSNSIQLNWNRNCPNRGVLLAFNTTNRFGTPVGNPTTVGSISGGGTKLINGTQTSFTHAGLNADQLYYYGFYSYELKGSTYEYSRPVIVLASTSCPEAAFDLLESFSTNQFAPVGWRVFDGGANGSSVGEGRTWRRYIGIGSRPNDDASALVRAFQENGNNSKEVLRSPQFIVGADVDSVFVEFDYAYRAYNSAEQLADSLELALSSDCGVNFTSIWKAGSEGLATVGGFQTSEFFPSSTNEWKHMVFDITTLAQQAGRISCLFRATNKFGQNIWLDNIVIRKVSLPKLDVLPIKILNPATPLVCDKNVTIGIRVKNIGKDAINSLQINYSFNNTAVFSKVFNGLNLPKGSDTALTLPLISITPGFYALKLWTSSPNSGIDQLPANDTIVTAFTVAGELPTPMQQNFETGVFAPGGWAIVNPDGGLTWQLSTASSSNGLASAFINNFEYSSRGETDLLVTPVLRNSDNIDSLFLEFNLAAATRVYTNTTGPVFDTLEISFTADCGKTYTSLYKKWGDALQTLNQPNIPISTAFVPNPNQWRRERISITPFIGELKNGYQIAFKNTTQNGNNIYIDDITVYGKRLPDNLKQKGYEIYPNPSRGNFILHHLQPPANLKAVTVYNALGQLVWQANYSTTIAPQQLIINLTNLSDGVYLVKLHYKDNSITRRIIKSGR